MMDDEQQQQQQMNIEEKEGEQQEENNKETDNNLYYDESYMKREQEFFKFHPYSFIDDVQQSAHDYCADSADYIEGCLSVHPSFSNNDKHKESIRIGTDKVWKLLEDSFTKNLNSYGDFLISQIFSIPDDIILPNEQQHPLNTNNNNKKSNVYVKSLNVIDKETNDLRINIQKLSNDNETMKIKINSLEQDNELLQLIDGKLTKDSDKNIEYITLIIQQRASLKYNYQVLQSKLSNDNNNINNNNNNNNNHHKSLFDKMNHLNLNDCSVVDSSTKILDKIEKTL